MKIQTSKSNKVVLTIGGAICIALGCTIFPKSTFQGFYEILPITISSCFIFFGILMIYYGLFYRIIIDENGVTTGNTFYNNTIHRDKIKGFFMFEEHYKKEKTLQLAILQTDGKSKIFNGDTLNERIKLIDNALAKNYKRLEGKDKVNFVRQHKNKKLRILSYGGIAIALLGIVYIYGFLKPEPKFITVHGTLIEQPEFSHNKRGKATRVNIKLKEYPNLIFSEVGNVEHLENWAAITAIGDKISIQLSENDYTSKIKKDSPPDQVILNYKADMVEIQSLTHHKLSSQPIYREDTAEGLVIGIIFLLFGLGAFFYYQRDIRSVLE